MKIEELLAAARIPFRYAGQHHHVSHGWVGLDCPWCSPRSGRFRLGIHLARLTAYCWTCGSHSLLDVLVEVLGEPHSAVRKMLGGLATATTAPKKRGTYRQPDGVGPLEEVHRDYLRSRGFNPDVVARTWRVRGIGLAPRLAWRLFIPITLRGEAVSYTTRAVVDGVRLRYITAPAGDEAVPCKSLLYGEDQAGVSVIVVEGPVDVWRIGPGAISTLGVGFSRAQVRRLLAFPVRHVCFDNERPAQRRAADLCRALSAFPGTTRRIQLDSKDPGSATDEEIAELRKLIR